MHCGAVAEEGLRRYWESIILAMIGEQFGVGSEICGAVISVRYNEDILALWNRNADNSDANIKIRDSMRKILRLPGFVTIEYKPHDLSMQDKSSFRNTSVWRNSRNREPPNSPSWNPHGGMRPEEQKPGPRMSGFPEDKDKRDQEAHDKNLQWSPGDANDRPRRW